MARTDVHRPAALVTEDYEYFGSGYYGTADEPGYSPLNTPQGAALLDAGWRFAGVSGGGCDHCGARLRFFALMLHAPSHTIIRVGETCLDNRFERASADFHRLRKQAQLDRERQRIKNERLRWFAVNPDAEVALAWAESQNSEFHYNFVRSVRNYGNASAKFLAAMMRDMARAERIAAERAAEAETATPVVAGKGIEITGEVVSVKWHENAYGGREVMTVKDARGFKVWGSVPASIDNVQKGDTVTFVANVEASDKDETFGFFKRPRAAKIAGI